ncbi:ankyrin [Coprinopsis marcescibilis]|uniref:Ankyrin n=1 Tax=Coprinopsis marcescibilis TaxID=230819 RepID=A0A5C3L7I6_COPMA|nr:ankyrin [Coprinopsis marcescibilis]
MGNKFSNPAQVVRKPKRRTKYSAERGKHNHAAQVLHGAQGVKLNNSPVTVAGRDVNNVVNVTNAYYNASETPATTDVDDALLVKILESLGELNFRRIYDDNLAKRTPETGREVIDSDWFREWLMDLLGGIVWGTGMPGAGKTVLACIVIEHLQKLVATSEANDVCLLFAFCRYTERLMVIDILLAILRQLLERYPQVLPYVKPMYQRHAREKTRPSEADVVDLLRQIATSGLFKKTFYILDGLDEAASDIQVDLLEILSSLPVHFFITSRPLDSLKDLVPHARFLTIIASDPDIALLVDQKIHRLPVLRNLLMKNATLKAEVVSIISSKSSGMFLLASLHLDMLKGCTNETQVRRALEGLPRGVDAMYGATMERIEALSEYEADLAKRALVWVAYAQAPLTVQELVLALSVCPQTLRFDDKLEPAGIESILSLCCGLIEVESIPDWSRERIDVVRFVHYSAAEYSIKNLELHYPEDPHALIASTCIVFLRHHGYHDVSSLESGNDKGLCDRFESLGRKQNSMASYPYKYWGSHAKKARSIPSSVLEFLDDCQQYPVFCFDYDRKYGFELPSEYFYEEEEVHQLERLQSIHVAALHGIREYFDRLKSEGWTSTARLQTHNVFNSRGSAGSTPLILSSMVGSEDVVAFLLEVEGVDVNLKDEREQTALYAAVANQHDGIVAAILSVGGVDVNQGSTRQYGWTPLTFASYMGQRSTVRLLLQAEGIDINRVSSHGSALALAAQEGHHDIIKMLLQIDGIDVRGALDKSLDQGFSDIIETLLEGGKASLDEGGSLNSLMCAARSGRSGAVMTVLNHGTFDINAKDDQGLSALAHSLKYASLPSEAAVALLQIPGIDVTSVDNDGTTILMLASGHYDAPKLVSPVIELGGTLNINTKDAKGRTALMHAARRGLKEIVEMLLAVEGIDNNCMDAKCRTPLMLAARGGFEDVLPLLLELEGIKIDCRDKKGRTALAYATSNRWGQAFDILLKVDSISANYTTSEGLTYLMLAAATGDTTRIKTVLSLAQFDVNARDLHGRTALAHAVGSRDCDAVETLLAVEGADVHCVDEQGMTLLMDAAMTSEVEMVNRLLELGMGDNINATNIEGKTALFFAVHRRSSDIMSALLKVEGIDCLCRDAQGKTPRMVALENGREWMAELLQEAGG